MQMWKEKLSWLTVPVAAVLVLVQTAQAQKRVTRVANARAEVTKKSTNDFSHEQTAIIKMDNDQGESLPVHAFCLNSKGHILAACGNRKGEIRIFDADGNYLTAWEIPVRPEAINVDPSDQVYVAGGGKVFKYSATGQLLLEKLGPHMDAPPDESQREALAKQLRKQLEDQAKQMEKTYTRQLKRYEKEIEKLSSKDELTRSEEKRMQLYKDAIKSLEEAMNQGPQTVSDEQVEQMIDAMSGRSSKVSSISATNQDVFLAVSAKVGYGYDVYRTDTEIGNAKQIINGLRGCCGQMDVQCCAQGVFVAENGRHRVSRYDRDGKEVKHWGERERDGNEGFGSCCNPMNVCFGPTGHVYTAESGLGRIKRFDAEGNLLGVVGKVKLVPGCKNVSIAVNNDGSRVYMLDITRSHIVMMTPVDSTQE